ncbi:efflux transporter outer membrane subunit [Xylophilus sp. Kf1]|nr:efflux transporter outer membrane subunit [Xylophilus sp. Kf1]
MFSRRSLTALAWASLLMSGCAVAPDEPRTDIALPDRFMGQAALDQRHATAAVELARWWDGFGVPELTQLVSLALAQNLDLAQASARLRQARAGLGLADAALLPSASVSGQAARVYQSVETPLGRVLDAQPGFDRYGNAYEVNLNAGWELDVFGGLRQEREARRSDYEASEAGLVAVRLAVAAQTADLYIALRGVQRRQAIALRQVETQRSLLTLVRQLHGKGLAADFERDQAEGALAQVQAAVPAMDLAGQQLMNAIDVLLGKAPGTYRALLTDSATFPSAPSISRIGTPAELLRRRPDLIVAERRVAAANARTGVALAEYYPKFSLGAMLGSATSISSGNVFTNGASQSAGLLGLRWRLFDFARIDAQIDYSRGQEAEALATYRLSALRASEEVENALTALVRRDEQAGLLLSGERSLAKARDASRLRYGKGVVNLVEVLQADDSLLRTQDGRAQAETEAARAAVAAFKALGGGWTPGGLPDA